MATHLCVWVFVFAWAVEANSQDRNSYVPPQQLDGNPTSSLSNTPTEQTESSLGLAGGEAPKSLFDKLMTEMENLIPGQLENNPERKKLVEEAIKSFQAKDAKQVVEFFDSIAAADKDFPPTDLLLAAMSFVIKDQSTGRLLLERAASKNVDNIGIHTAFSRLAINEGRISDAILHLDKIKQIAIEQKLSETAANFYARQYHDGMIDVAMRQSRFTDARALLVEQRQKLPDNPKVLMVSAELEFREKNYDKSLGYLSQLKDKYPASRAPESILASWFQRINDNEQSSKWIVAAAEKYPNDAQVQLEYASWAINKEDFPTASMSIKKAEDATKETGFSKNLKGKIAFAERSYVAAEYHYEALAQANPGNFDAVNMYILSLIESTDEAKQKKALDLAIQSYRKLPDNIVAQAALGYVQLRLGNLEQAKIALARGAQAKRGASPEIDFFVASVLKEMGEPEKARGVLDISLKHDGFYLYRSAAKKMLEELGGSLPEGYDPSKLGSKPKADLPKPDGSGTLPAPENKK